ncbi:hypothetical protein BGX27_011423 [Mortierella sp. AM989]|nr:hypothetical protein BGX27_011423 [Mortierella sp. AM989]
MHIFLRLVRRNLVGRVEPEFVQEYNSNLRHNEVLHQTPLRSLKLAEEPVKMAKRGSRSSFSITNSLIPVAKWAVHVSDSMIIANKVSATNFELQMNQVSCTAGMASGDTESDATSTASAIICSPPESKLFGDARIVNGTPSPGSAGARVRTDHVMCHYSDNRRRKVKYDVTKTYRLS